MPYRLGVDLGTTFTAAAVWDGVNEPTVLGLGNRALQIPSVLFLQPDGEFLVGEAAERRGLTEPDRLAREFKRRIGDHVPIMVAGAPLSPEALTSHLLRWVLNTAIERMGESPTAVILTHPANWGPFRLELLEQVAVMAGVGPVQRCTEPEAAAAQYAAQTRVAPGDRVAVYDLGGGTFDACVLEKTDTGFRTLGSPEGLEHLGGVDFDEAVLRHVIGSLGPGAAALDPDDPAATIGLARLRRDCVEAKEALSTEVDTQILVALPELNTTVRVTRAEFELMIRPALMETLAALGRALGSAHVEASTLQGILLIGGSSRIPLVSELVAREYGVPTMLGNHPKHDVALGSVRAAPGAAAVSNPAPAPRAVPALGETARPRQPAAAVSAPENPIASSSLPIPAPAVRPSFRPRGPLVRWLAVALAVIALGIGAGVVISLNNGKQSTADPPILTTPTSSTSTSSTPTSSSPTPSPTPSTPTPRPAPTPRWQRGTNLPEPLEAAGVTAFGGGVWVIGGDAPSAGRPALDKVWVFKNGWKPGPKLPLRLDSAAVASDGNRLFVVGGHTTDAAGKNQRISRDVWVLDGPEDDSWRVLNRLPAERSGGAVAWDGQRLVFAGGLSRRNGDGAETVNHDDVWVWAGDGEWRKIGKLQRPREDLVAASDGNGRVWFLGGADVVGKDGRVPMGAVDLVTANRVTRQADIAPVRSSSAVWLPDRGVCVLGGVTRKGAANSLANRVACIPETASPSTTLRPLPPMTLPRAGLGAAVQGRSVWVVGGFGPERKGKSVRPGLATVEILNQ